MAINWPIPSSIGELFTDPNGSQWKWNGKAWVSIGIAFGSSGTSGTSGLADRYSGTSSTTIVIPEQEDLVNFNTQRNLAFIPGQTIYLYNDLITNYYLIDDYVEDLGSVYILGEVDNYDRTTGSMSMVVQFGQPIGGTYSQWYITLTGERGLKGATGSFGSSGTSGTSGSIGPQGLKGATGSQGPQGQSSNLFYYKGSTASTSGDPGSGYISWNSIGQTGSTYLYVNMYEEDGTDIDVFLGLIIEGQQIIIQDRDDSISYQKWVASGTPSNSTGYWEIPVTYYDSSSLGTSNFLHNDQLFLGIFNASGTSGTSGLLSLTGTTNNGLITLDGTSPNGNVETNLTFDGSILNVKGGIIASASTTTDLVRITQTGAGNAFVVKNSPTQGTNPLFAVNNYGVALGVVPFDSTYRLYVSGSIIGKGSDAPGVVGETYGDVTGTYTGVYGYASSNEPYVASIYVGGHFLANGSAYNDTNYSVWLQDGTESTNKVLVSKTSDGKANWSNTLTGLTSVSTTTLNASGNLTVSGTSSLNGLTVFSEVSEVVTTSYGATNSSVTYDFNTGAIWYHDSASTNYTAKFTNLPITNNRILTATIMISQGSTGYSPTILQIDGVTQPIKWAGGTYSVSTNKVDIIGFTFLRSGSVWTQVLGQISSFS